MHPGRARRQPPPGPGPFRRPEDARPRDGGGAGLARVVGAGPAAAGRALSCHGALE